MPTLTIDVPDISFAGRHLSPEEFLKEMRLAAAIYWYSRGEISHEIGAAIAGLDRTDFIDALARERVEAFHVDIDELKEEVERGLQAHRERLAADPTQHDRPA
jgi:predicted HTH domain antitoxin